MFSPLLQGDLPRVLPSALHQTAALCASWRRVLGLFCAFLRYTLLSYPLPCGLSRILLPILCAWGILALAEGTGGPPVGCRPRRFEDPFDRGDGRVWDPPLRKYGKLSGERRRGRSQTGPPITIMRCSRRGQPPPYKRRTFKKWKNVRRAALTNPAITNRIRQGRAGGDTRPYKRGRLQVCRGPPFSAGGPLCRPYGGNRTGSVGSAT